MRTIRNNQTATRNPLEISSNSGGVTLIASLALFIVVAAAMLYLNPWSSSANGMPQASVEVTKSSFQPPSLTIAAGSQVTWINSDDSPHQIASQQLIGPRAPEPMAKGESYSYIFEVPGTYSYYDVLGAEVLIGTIVVE